VTGATILVVDTPIDIENIRGIIAAEPTVALVYLFGSRAAGNAGPMSDYDFGVVFDHGAEPDEVQAALATALARALGTDRIDLVALNRAPVELAYALIAQGVVVHQRDGAVRRVRQSMVEKNIKEHG